MTEQEQIDSLKIDVVKLGTEVRHLQRCLSLMVAGFSDPPDQPQCGDCGMLMYEDTECDKPASECPMGIGSNESEKQ